MTAKTRYFVIASLLIMFVGLGTGLVAYYVGFPATAFFNHNSPDELRYFPSSVSVLGFVEVREIMASELRQRLRQVAGTEAQDNGRRQLQELTGINFETDIEHIVGGFDAGSPGGNNALVIARGVFDNTKIEALMREHGAEEQDYKGKRLVIAEHFGDANQNSPVSPSVNGFPNQNSFALAFIAPGLVAFGSTPLVRHAIDLGTGGGESAATNEDLLSHVRALEGGNAWAVGRLDVLRSKARLPEVVVGQLPPITWFGFRGRVDGGLQALVTADTKDDESANQLRDVIRGFLALARLQTSSKPEFQHFVQSLQLGGTGKTVSLALDVPAQVFDALGAVIPKPPSSPRTPQ